MFHSALKDVRLRIEFLIAEGDRVVDHWTLSAVHKGEFLGLPATGKSITITGTDISRLAGGKIAEVWHVEDILGMMQELGAIPAMNEAQPATRTERRATGRTESGASVPMRS
jgi:predicted ester cyclase